MFIYLIKINGQMMP